ncbi:MAG: hypothetical protein WCC57_16395 [Paracoccaceae bacterium]
MPLPELALALGALLISPGPTNTLLALSGAERGLRATLTLLPLVLLAYLAMVLPLLFLGAKTLTALPALRPVVAIAAAIWVAKLAVTLWHLPSVQSHRSSVTARSLITTTLLNPKALIIGLVLLPAPAAIPARLLVFAALLLIASGIWAAIGAGVSQASPTRPAASLPPILRRVAAVWLAILSLGLAAGGLST